MAKRTHSRKQNGVRKVFRGVTSAFSSFLIGGPVFVPGILAVNEWSKGGQPLVEFVWQTSAYNLNTGAVDMNKLKDVIIRDAVLVGIGLGIKYLGKRI